MNRITVTFYDEVIEKLENRITKKGTKSIAHCIRELVDFGLKIEDAAERNESKSGNDDELKTLVKMLQADLKWSLESRLLVRYLVENLPENAKRNHVEFIETCKQRAIGHIEGMLNNLMDAV